MCGIGGVASYNKPIREDVSVWGNMQKTLKRRGPDQDGIYTSAYANLIHTRLSVVDLENGVQPMIFKQADVEYALIYNGELYNTSELREELKNCGHTFRGHSDTEVLLHAYIEWKAECVHRLNGIFAFAVWENHNGRLFIARDRLGVKPFFYANMHGSQFLFSSEIKTLFAHPALQPQIDDKSIAELILVGPGRTPGFGVFKGVEELPAAFCGYFDKVNGLKISQYWKPQDKPHTDSFEQTVENVRALITDAI